MVLCSFRRLSCILSFNMTLQINKKTSKNYFPGVVFLIDPIHIIAPVYEQIVPLPVQRSFIFSQFVKQNFISIRTLALNLRHLSAQGRYLRLHLLRGTRYSLKLNKLKISLSENLTSGYFV